MIDRERVRGAFRRYTARFDDTELMIANKKRHTFHVAGNCEKIAAALGLDQAQPDLAWMIGVLHDIGRFEQIRQTHSYTDKALDHAELGVRLLFDDGLISQFADGDEEIIRKAVLFHNKLELPSTLSEEERLFCSIIRDADKTDIFRGFRENDFVSFHERTVEQVQRSRISDGVMKCFREHRTIPRSEIKTDADFFLLPYALYFGLVFPCSRELVKEQGNYRQMLDFEFTDPENRMRFEIIKREIGYRD